MSPAKFLVSRYKSSFPRSSARTSSARRDQTHETCPNYSSGQPDSNCTTELAAHIHGSERFPLVFPIAPRASRRSPARVAISQSHESIPNSALPCQFLRTRPALPASPQPPDPDCSSTFAALLPAANPCTKSPFPAPPETALYST